MKDYTLQNKRAWEYDAYAFWVKQMGEPAKAAQDILADPNRGMRRFARYFHGFEGLRVANICGSCGKKALAMAALGAQVSVFDLSEANRRYAMEMAQAAGYSLDYQLGDVMEIDLGKYGACFDVVFMEGGILS